MATNKRPSDTKTLLDLHSVAAASASQWMELTDFVLCSFTIRVECSAAFTGAGTLVMRGTNFTPQDPTSPPLIFFYAVDAPAAAGGFAMDGATGVLTVNPSAAGLYIASFTNFTFAKFVQAEWLGGEGGGTVSIKVVASGW
jgi:hypothetical protein